MSLIEGIGDEVTLVLACFTVAVILILAWFSTNIADPLLREVGVIVVELGQRRNRGHQITNERTPDSDQQQSGRALQEPVQSITNSEPTSASDIAEECGDADALSISSSNVAVRKRQQNVSHGASDSMAASEKEEGDSALGSSGDVRLDDSPPDRQLSDSQDSATPVYESTEEEIRRRRVAFYQQDSSTRSNDLLRDTSTDIIAERLGHGAMNETFNEVGMKQVTVEEGQNTVPSNSESQSGTASCINSDVVESSKQTLHETSSADALMQQDVSNDTVTLSEQQQHTVSSDPHSGVNGSSFPSESSNSRLTSQEPSLIRIKLKYMNETQRLVSARPEDTIGDFRRTNFQSELQDNKWVRFIFNGQDLRDDARTLQSFSIVDNCTVHCLITAQNQSSAVPDSSVEEEDDSMLGAMMYPLFTVVLLVVWYFRFTYRQYFSSLSTICLIGISFLLVLSYVSSLRPGDSQHQPQQTTNNGSQRRPHAHSD